MSLYPEDVPFEVKREKWSVYDLGDGCTLRVKITLQKVLKPPGVPLDKVQGLNFNHHVHLVVDAPLNKKGAPETKQLTKQFLQDSIVEDIDPKPISTSKNEYLLENGTIVRLSLMFTRVGKTDIYAADGSPVYIFSHQIVPQIQFPKRRKRKGKTSGVV